MFLVRIVRNTKCSEPVWTFRTRENLLLLPEFEPRLVKTIAWSLERMLCFRAVIDVPCEDRTKYEMLRTGVDVSD